jgi:hypothetical protein
MKILTRAARPLQEVPPSPANRTAARDSSRPGCRAWAASSCRTANSRPTAGTCDLLPFLPFVNAGLCPTAELKVFFPFISLFLHHRALVVEEILMTEENYIDDLRLCIDVRLTFLYIYIYLHIFADHFSCMKLH